MLPPNSQKDFEALNDYDGELELRMPVKHTDPALRNEVLDFTMSKATHRVPLGSFRERL